MSGLLRPVNEKEVLLRHKYRDRLYKYHGKCRELLMLSFFQGSGCKLIK